MGYIYWVCIRCIYIRYIYRGYIKGGLIGGIYRVCTRYVYIYIRCICIDRGIFLYNPYIIHIKKCFGLNGAIRPTESAETLHVLRCGPCASYGKVGAAGRPLKTA